MDTSDMSPCVIAAAGGPAQWSLLVPGVLARPAPGMVLCGFCTLGPTRFGRIHRFDHDEMDASHVLSQSQRG
jgi:hypothetical protein